MNILRITARFFLLQHRKNQAGARRCRQQKRRGSSRIAAFPERGMDRFRGWLAAVFLACVLSTAAQDAQVVAWGINSSSPTNVPRGLTNVVAIAGGGYHSLALKADGTVVAWGDNFLNQTNVPPVLTNVVAIAAGVNHSMALKADGMVVAWGYQRNVPAALTNVVAIAGGYYHSLALKANGTVVAWGGNNYGQTNVLAGLTNIVAIAGGDYHSLALQADGTVVAWGDNRSGQTNVPAGLTNVVAIAGGGYHSLALKANGSVVAWGQNIYGQTNVPANLTNVVAIAGGMFHNVALVGEGPPFIKTLVDRTVVVDGKTQFGIVATGSRPLMYQWRFNGANIQDATNAVLTLNDAQASQEGLYSLVVSNSFGVVASREARLSVVPVFIAAQPQDFSILAGGTANFTVADQPGLPVFYQWFEDGEAILGATDAVLSLTNVQPSQAGLYSVVVSNSFGVVTSREARLSIEVLSIAAQPQDFSALPGGMAGFTVALQSAVPVFYQWLREGEVIPGATNAVYELGPLSFSEAGGYSVLVSNLFGSLISRTARLTVSTVVAWGRNDYGQTMIPPGLSNVVAMAGGSHSLALQADGKVVAWGYGAYGQTNVPLDLTNAIAIAAGDNHSLALKTNGTVVAWGSNGNGQTTVPPGLTNVVAIAGGGAHSLALKADRTVVAWGFNGDGQTNVPAGLTNVVGIAGGGYHSLGLKADGSVIAWGDNSYGQTRIPSGLTHALAIAGGGYHSLALKADGSVTAWGNNGNHQTNVPSGLTNVVAIAAGESHSLALQADGTVVAWGYNVDGQTNISTGLTNVVAIAGGQYHSLALGGWGRPFINPLIDRMALGGGTVQFSIAVTGFRPLMYQWRFNGANIQDATNAALILNNVQTSQEGTYSVVVSNSLGVAASREARLSVVPLFIAAQPQDFFTLAGGTASFTVATQPGLPALYQWFEDGEAISGATDAVLSLTNVQPSQAGLYSVVVSNSFGAVTSRAARLSVELLLIAAQPQHFSSLPGGMASFTVVAQSAVPAFYQWLKDGTAIHGATNAVYRLVPLFLNEAGGYSVVVSNVYGSVTSRTAQLTVSPIVAWGRNNYGQTNVPAGLTNVLAVAGGGDHSLALLADGSVVAWGYNHFGQTDVPAGLANVVAIAGGGYHSLALKADRTVAAWGYNRYSQTTVPAGLTNVVAIAGGYYHSLALKANGSVVAWGYNNCGQTNAPAGLTNVVAIAGGYRHSLALTADGTVVAWGDNKYGQTQVPAGLTSVVAIAGGYYHSLALKVDGTVVAWEYNNYGQTNVPAGLTNVVAIAGSDFHSLALKADGTVVAWGDNNYGQTNVPWGLSNVVAIAGGGVHSMALGGWADRPFINTLIDRMAVVNGTVQFHISTSGSRPLKFQWRFNGVNILNATNAVLSMANVQLSQQGFYSVAVSNAWGLVTSREARLSVVPLLIAAQPQDLSVLVGGMASFTVAAQFGVPAFYQWLKDGEAIPGATNTVYSLGPLSFNDAGRYSVEVSNIDGSLASRTARLTVCPTLGWGRNDCGQTNVPTDLTNVVAIAGGGSHSLALQVDGSVMAWGNNGNGQADVPSGLTNVVAIAGGGYHSMALKSDGIVVAWGNNGNGQIQVPAGLSNVVAIAGGDYHSLALLANGRAVAWGSNVGGKTNIPAGLMDVVAIAGGGDYSLALKADGSVVAWGQNTYGQTNVPANLTNVVAIAGGGDHSLALKADRTVVAWGNNSYGQTTVPAGLTNVVAIAGGYYHSLALKDDGTVVAWGQNYEGQTTLPAGLMNVVAIAGGGDHSLALGGWRPPFVSVPLVNRLVSGGDSVQLRVTATGCRPMTFQWRFKGVTLPDATNTVLSLVNIQPGDEGFYSVVVSNAYGSVTNDVAILSLLDSSTLPEIPVQSAARLTNGGFHFMMTNLITATIEIQARTNLSTGAWETLRSLTNNGGGVWFTDPETNHPQRFYRLKQ